MSTTTTTTTPRHLTTGQIVVAFACDHCGGTTSLADAAHRARHGCHACGYAWTNWHALDAAYQQATRPTPDITQESPSTPPGVPVVPPETRWNPQGG